jgi:hypothetical protein
VRQSKTVEAYKGDKFAAARVLQLSANIPADAETAKLTKVDADYFFSKH